LISTMRKTKIEFFKDLILENNKTINGLKYNLIKIQADIGICENRKKDYERKLKKYEELDVIQREKDQSKKPSLIGRFQKGLNKICK